MKPVVKLLDSIYLVTKMKRIYYLFFLLFCFGNVAVAQKIPARYDFYYIAHDKDTPVGELIEILTEASVYAERLASPAIFYLANGDNPIVVKFNTPDANENDFEKVLLQELRVKDYHTPAGHKDLLKILDIINENDFVVDGRMIPDTFFQFYVGKDFWERECNISIIAALYMILNIEHYINEGMIFEILSHQSKEIQSYCQDPNNPKEYRLFGEQDYNGLNESITIYEY